jgi:hypothetical protein
VEEKDLAKTSFYLGLVDIPKLNFSVSPLTAFPPNKFERVELIIFVFQKVKKNEKKKKKILFE